jgi:hypothetical protein
MAAPKSAVATAINFLEIFWNMRNDQIYKKLDGSINFFTSVHPAERPVDNFLICVVSQIECTPFARHRRVLIFRRLFHRVQAFASCSESPAFQGCIQKLGASPLSSP